MTAVVHKYSPPSQQECLEFETRTCQPALGLYHRLLDRTAMLQQLCATPYLLMLTFIGPPKVRDDWRKEQRETLRVQRSTLTAEGLSVPRGFAGRNACGARRVAFNTVCSLPCAVCVLPGYRWDDRAGDRPVPRGLLAFPCRNACPASAPLGGVPCARRWDREALSSGNAHLASSVRCNNPDIVNRSLVAKKPVRSENRDG